MTSKINEKGIKMYTSHPWELIKTLFLVFTWIVLGAHLELIGPTINVLSKQTNVTYNGISTILITRGAGYMVANIAGGITQNIVKKHPEGLLSFAFLIAAITMFATPVIHSLRLLATIFFFQGISQGVTDLGGTNLMLTMWGNNVAAPLNVVHLGYGFGAVFANLFVQPFLVEDTKFDSLLNNNSTNLIKEEKSNILVPYSITSILCLIIAIGHLLFSIREHRIRRDALKHHQINYASVSTSVANGKQEVELKNTSQYSPRSCGNGYFGYGLSMSICWIFYMFFLSGNDQTFGKFFFVYLKSSNLSISTKGATWGMIIYWLSYSIGRLICAIITIFVPVHVALSGLWVCGLTLAVTWYINVAIGLTSTSLFVLGAFTGLVFSPTFPLSFGFINQRLNVNPLLVGFLLCGAAFGAMLFQKIAGVLLDSNPENFPKLLIICVVISIVFFIIASIISSIHQRKLKSSENSAKIKDNKYDSNINEEEQQMEAYLKNNGEDKN
ncbi:unnamed protein product [Rotaria magnacalcarata]